MHTTTLHKQPNNSEDKGKGVNVQVVVRSRPLNTRETEGKETTIINCSPHTKEITFTNPRAAVTKTFSFDAVYGPNSTQSELFDQTVRPIVDEVLKGFNCTLFAYGQTGTGKTYTMEGKPDSEVHAGVIPRSIHYIFDSLEKSSSEYTVRVSHMELYNEELRDLLGTENKPLRIYDGMMVDVTGKKGCTVSNLEEVIVSNAKSIFDVIENSCRKRQTAETLLNPYSSRSHCIFTITIHTKEATPDGEDLLKVGKLNLVDLAGSENIQRSGAAGDRRREAGVINTSLLTLGRVINALTEHSSHIPYRESKLTRLLQDSLGGKTKTCIIATVSPANGSMEETLSTLDYAYRAKNIRNRPEVNQKMTRKALIKEYISEIEKLKVLLQATREKNGVYVPTETFASMESELTLRRAQVGDVEQILEKREAELEALKATVGEKVVEIETKDKIILSSKEELENTTHQFNLTKDSLLRTQKQLTTHKSYEHALLSNLDASLYDREQLFNKIDRKKTVESANKSSMEQARLVLLDKVKWLETTMDQAHSSQNTFLRDLEFQLHTLEQRKHEHIQALGNQSDLLTQFVANATNNLDTISRTIQSNSTNAMTMLSTQAQQQYSVWHDHACQFYRSSLLVFDAMQTIITKQSKETAFWAASIMESIRQQQKQTNRFLDLQATAIHQISDEATQLSSQASKLMMGHKHNLDHLVDERIEEMNTWHASFLTQIGEMIRTEVSRQGEKLKSDVAVFTSELDTNINDMNQIQHNMQQSVDNSIKDINAYHSVSNLFADSQETESHQFVECHNVAMAEFNETAEQFGRKAGSYNQQWDELLRDSTSQLTEKTREASDMSTTLHGTHQKHLIDLTQAINTWSENTDIQKNTFQNHINAHTSFCTEQVSLASMQAIQTQKDAQALLCDLRKNVTTMYLLKEDQPTGVTPIKKAIPIPMLVQFSPTTNNNLPPSPSHLMSDHTPTRTIPSQLTQPLPSTLSLPLSQPPHLQPQSLVEPNKNPPQTLSTPTPPVLNTQPPSVDTIEEISQRKRQTPPANINPSPTSNIYPTPTHGNPPIPTPPIRSSVPILANSLPTNPLPANPLPVPTPSMQPPNAPASKHSRIPKMVVDKKSLKSSNKENLLNVK